MKHLLLVRIKAKNAFLPMFFWILCLNALAQAPTIQWQKVLGGTEHDVPQCIYQTTDGGYIVGGAAGSKDGDLAGQHGNGDMWVVKLTASGVPEWRKALGGGGVDKGTLVQQTLDGGYIIGGITFSSNGDVRGNHGGGDIWVLKLSTTGDMLWQRCLGGSSTDELVALQEITAVDPANGALVSKGILVGGNTVSGNGDVAGYHGGKDVWVVKLDGTKGTIQWQRPLGSNGDETLNHLEATPDGGCVVGSRTSTNGGDVSGVHGSVDLWVVKLKEDGSIAWKRTLGGSGLENFAAVKPTKDGGYIVGTHCNSNDYDVIGTSTTTTIWIAKLSATGALLWQKKFDEYSYSEYRDMRQTDDEGFVICGAVYKNGDGNADVLLVKLTASGTISWARQYGASKNDEPYKMQQTTDGGYIVEGATNSPEINGFHEGPIDQWLLKLNAKGDKLWEKAYGGSDEDWHWRGCCGATTLGYDLGMVLHASLLPHHKLQASDGGYFFAVATKSRDGDVTGLHYNARIGVRADWWVVKLSAGTPSTPTTRAPRAKDILPEVLPNVRAFPNPFHQQTTLEFTATANGNARVDLYGPTGVQVRTLFNNTVKAGKAYRISVQDALLPQGVYTYSIRNAGSVSNGRLVKH